MSPRHRPCESCRKQHVKCNGYPTCSRCEKQNRECRRVETKWRFRHALPLGFIDETTKYTDLHPGPTSPAREHTSNDQPAIGTAVFSPQIPGPIPFNSHSSPSPTLAHSSRHHQHFYTGPHSRHLSTSSSSPPTIPSSLQASHTAWPSLTPQDACLLRYFIENLSRWFDLTDPENHFATVIPQRARSCPTLLDALLAVSARHFSTLPPDQKCQLLTLYGFPQSANAQHPDLEINEETVLHYHNRCITELRKLADRSEAVMDEDLLAAVVALRFFEELDNPFTTPTETALQGLHVFLSAQACTALSTPGPRQASFWIAYRQEFNLALSQQRVTRLPVDLVSETYLHFDEAEDHVWTNRLVVIGSLVLRYCYGPSSPDTLAQGGERYTYEELIQLREKWTENRPRSFAPMYVDSNPGDNFPKIWFMDDSHIVAAQTLSLLSILLLAYTPHLPKLGPTRKSTLDDIDSQIRGTVLEVCGMALSNRQSRPAGLTACIAINLCADRFTDLEEQRALMRLVKGTTQDSNYWPTGGLEGWLRGVWGWDCES